MIDIIFDTSFETPPYAISCVYKNSDVINLGSLCALFISDESIYLDSHVDWFRIENEDEYEDEFQESQNQSIQNVDRIRKNQIDVYTLYDSLNKVDFEIIGFRNILGLNPKHELRKVKKKALKQVVKSIQQYEYRNNHCAKLIQRAWRECICNPSYKLP